MVEVKRRVRPRDAALSRAQIVGAAIEVLDRDGEAGLTFKVLAEELATGPGAIYNHIASKHDLMAAAADAIVAEVQHGSAACDDPIWSLSAFALGMFDALDAHPWVGGALTRMPDLPIVRILDAIGRDIRALGIPAQSEWAAAMALFNYILGVSVQNAANAQFARAQGRDRTEALGALAQAWSQLDPADYPFAHSMGEQLRANDDRADFLAGIDFIVAGILAMAKSR